MRVLMVTQAEKTHFLSMVPLAWALRTAGHEVRVASQPELEAVAVSAGLTFAPVGRDHLLRQLMHLTRRTVRRDGPDFDLTGTDTDTITWEYVRDGYREIVPWWWKVVNEPMLDDLVGLCRTWRPDLVIWEPTTFAAPIAARVVGAAHVRWLFGLDTFARMRGHHLRLMGEQPPEEREDALAAWLSGRVSDHGGAFSEDMTLGQATIDFVPRSLRLPVNLPLRSLPVRYVPYNGPSVVPRWLRVPPLRPRICLSLGTSATEALGGYVVSVEEVLDALADLDVEVVATLPEAEQAKLRRTPGNARLVSFVPLHALAPTCSALITHGGPGTVFTMLACGVPPLIVPQSFDDPLVADQVAARGAGLTLPRAEADGPRIRDGVVRLLNEPAFAGNAAEVRAEMRAMPAPNRLVAALERFTG
ncbi:glycosyltransferase, activator-dependent family [Sinosporangium album]|uniref:Glycosyltransferase, activator-dependent family n=1 Tax=Sinosporangium album TaxID=504805 RepID=A0A1G8GI93_9ACTN|nr:activator-dependent family glycosyltransferase [Sinosporangium album]SDH94102.1 glycosyltransferase, activator-dependent family [Sinosporangium album]